VDTAGPSANLAAIYLLAFHTIS